MLSLICHSGTRGSYLQLSWGNFYELEKVACVGIPQQLHKSKANLINIYTILNKLQQNLIQTE